MNTYFEGGVDIELFKDFGQVSENVESAWINLSEQIIFNDKDYRICILYYSEFQCEVILLFEDLEQKDIVIYFELMTKSKINHVIKIIQNDQQSLNMNSLNNNFKALFD